MYIPSPRKWWLADNTVIGPSIPTEAALRKLISDQFEPQHLIEAPSGVRWAHPTYGPVRQWNTSLITNMSGLFASPTIDTSTAGVGAFDLSLWDVSNVKDMTNMFGNIANAKKLLNGQDLSKWNVSNVRRGALNVWSAFDDRIEQAPRFDWNAIENDSGGKFTKPTQLYTTDPSEMPMPPANNNSINPAKQLINPARQLPAPPPGKFLLPYAATPAPPAGDPDCDAPAGPGGAAGGGRVLGFDM